MFCSKCGSQLPDTSKFCNVCGQDINNIAPAVQPTHVNQSTLIVGNKQRCGSCIFTLVFPWYFWCSSFIHGQRYRNLVTCIDNPSRFWDFVACRFILDSSVLFKNTFSNSYN